MLQQAAPCDDEDPLVASWAADRVAQRSEGRCASYVRLYRFYSLSLRPLVLAP